MITVWSHTPDTDILPQQSGALKALCQMRSSKGRVRIRRSNLPYLLEHYRETTAHAPRLRPLTDHTHGPQVISVLPTRQGEVVVFSDHSALGLRNYGDRVELPDVVFLGRAGVWTYQSAQSMFDHHWRPGRRGPRSFAEWCEPAVGIEHVMPALHPTHPSIQDRHDAVQMMVEALWPQTVPRTSLLFSNHPLNGSCIRFGPGFQAPGDPGHATIFATMLKAASHLYPGRLACPRTWNNTSNGGHLTMVYQPFAWADLTNTQPSAHTKIANLQHLRQAWPEVYATIEHATHTR